MQRLSALALLIALSVPGLPAASKAGQTPGIHSLIPQRLDHAGPVDADHHSKKHHIGHHQRSQPHLQKAYPAMLAPDRAEPLIHGERLDGGTSPRPRLAPLSANVLDPYTTVTQSPSGSIVVTNPYSIRHGQERRRYRQARMPSGPYAPPAFHIIGEMSRKHMGRPVQLTHGIKPARRLRTEPKVMFLVQKPGESRLSVLGRHRH